MTGDFFAAWNKSGQSLDDFVVDAEKLHSRAPNTAFEGRKFQGRARATFVGGECVFDAR